MRFAYGNLTLRVWRVGLGRAMLSNLYIVNFGFISERYEKRLD
jgi:hypothetical protein